MSSQFIILPLLVHFFSTVVLLFFWGKVRVQRVISVAGNMLSLVVALLLFVRIRQSGMLVAQMGNWPAPFGITMVGDVFAAALVLLVSLLGLAVALHGAGSLSDRRLLFGFFPILHFLLLGLSGAFLAGDVFNLYVWFEIIIISSFVLITLGGERKQLEGAVKYFTLNVLASVVFLTAIAFLYGLAGTLNMADLAVKVPSISNQGLVRVSALLFFIGFGIKSAVFPMYFWLPASYHTPPSAISAIFAGLLTKVGVYALIRMFSLVYAADVVLWEIILWVAAATLFTGGIGALVEKNISRLFSYFIVCHIGYMVAGLGMYTEAAMAGAVFYMLHDIPVKANLFLGSGLIQKIGGTANLHKLGGLYATYPLLSLLLAVPLFSVAGIPPLSGFWPKLSLILAGADTGRYAIIGFMLFGSFITLFVTAKLWAEVFWKNKPEAETGVQRNIFERLSAQQQWLIVAPMVMLALVSLYIGFGAEHVQRLSARIASELLSPESYIRAVLK